MQWLPLLLFTGLLPATACESDPDTKRAPSEPPDDSDDDSMDDDDSAGSDSADKPSAMKDAGPKKDRPSNGDAIDGARVPTDASAPDRGQPEGGSNPGDGGANRGPSATNCSGDQVPVNGSCVDRKLPTELGPGWNKIDPGPPTTCIFGAPYSFYVRKGNVNKVLLFLQGGGACWDDTTCLLPIYVDTASAPGSSGIFDPENPENPFKDYYMVYAPYCSADVGLGDSTQEYSLGTAQHKGFVNMEAVLGWIYENITAPEFAFISGCSAGAVGVVLAGGYLVKAYAENPEVDGAMITDSFQAIITDGFAGLVNWNVAANFPEWLPKLRSLKQPFPGDIMAQGIKEALALPEFSRFVAGHFNYADDAVQGLFYGFMGGDPAEVSGRIKEAVHDMSASAPNYRYFLAPGASHCVFESDLVYSEQSSNMRLIEWLDDIANDVDVKSVE